MRSTQVHTLTSSSLKLLLSSCQSQWSFPSDSVLWPRGQEPDVHSPDYKCGCKPVICAVAGRNLWSLPCVQTTSNLIRVHMQMSAGVVEVIKRGGVRVGVSELMWFEKYCCCCCCCCCLSVMTGMNWVWRGFFFFFFPPSEHHILHLLAYKSPCAVCLKAPLASGSVNLFVVRLSSEKKKNNHKC